MWISVADRQLGLCHDCHDGGDDGDRGHGHVCFLHGDGVCIDARHGDDGAHGDAGRGRRDIFPRGNRDGDLDDVHDLSERRGLT